MKRYSLIFIAGALLAMQGCGDSNTVSKEDAQLKKLSHTWQLTSATMGGTEQEGYANMELTLSGSATSEVFAYAVVGRPLISPWPLAGNWIFGSPVSSQLVRDPSTEDELNVTYQVSTTELVIEFQFSGAGYDASRVNSAEGHWVFTFSKK